MTNTIAVLVASEVLSATTDGSDAPMRLRDAMQTFYTGEVVLREDSAESAADGALLLAFGIERPRWIKELPSSVRETILARVFLLKAERAPQLFDTLERDHLAGACDALAYARWQHQRVPDNGYGIAGLRTIVDEIGGKYAGQGFTSEHYGIYRSAAATSLPQALVEYLGALARRNGKPSTLS